MKCLLCNGTGQKIEAGITIPCPACQRLKLFHEERLQDKTKELKELIKKGNYKIVIKK